MRNTILEALQAGNGGFVSGEMLCRDLGVSRTVVWREISALREKGYTIEAVTRKGYRLLSEPDILTEDQILAHLSTKRFGREMCLLSEVDSTNQAVKAGAEQQKQEGYLVCANSQTAGKGRRGRAWSTPPASSVAMSVLLKPSLLPDEASMITILSAVAVCRTLKQLIPEKKVEIKWPNDVVVSGKKICGILTEMSMEMDSPGISYVVCGIGVNVKKTAYPEEIAEKATSVEEETTQKVSRSMIIAMILNEFETLYDTLLQTHSLSFVREEYESVLAGRNRDVQVEEWGKVRIGRCLGVDELGRLLVQFPEEKEVSRLFGGEISVRGLMGYV